MRKFLCLLLLVNSAHAQASLNAYTIRIRGYDLSEIQQVKNCIDYSICRMASNDFNADFNQPQMTINVFLDFLELGIIEERCLAPARFGNVIEMFDKITKQPVFSKPLLLGSTGMNAKVSTQVNVKEYSKHENAKIQATLNHLLKAGQQMKAIHLAVDRYQLQFANYNISLDTQGVDEYVITKHDLKEVIVGKNGLSDACSLVEVLRHEAEHITQVARANACAAKKRTSTFSVHLFRERAAYLGDIYNFKRFCQDEKAISPEMVFRYRYLFEHYGKTPKRYL